MGTLGDISDAEFNAIANKIKTNELKTPFDVFIAANRALVFKTNETAVAPPQHYARLYQQLSTLNNEAVFESFNATFIKVQGYDGEEDRILVSFTANGTAYQTVNYYSENFLIDSSFYKIMNRVLADKNSPYRFYYVYYRKPSSIGFETTDWHTFGVISLTEQQAYVLREAKLLDISYGEHDILSTDTMNNIVATFKKTGLFSHLNEESFERERQELFRYTYTNPLPILSSFSNVTYWFDAETSNFENPYEEITLGLVDVSHGAFTPMNITDNFTMDEPTPFSFVFDGKRYETNLTSSGDWLDLSFIDLITRALNESKVDGNFYLLDTGDQSVQVIFLTTPQYETIVANRLLPIVAESDAVERGKEFEEEVFRRLGGGKELA
ncbi:MAG: hypothetical protein HYY37_03685 [Candidatus Aenigmarchaeota archaeon]|nr:hypothetical protein [Candidatus Aenigmarchaeota archaeon]